MCSFHNIVVARDALEELRERGVPMEKCSHISNGVDTGLFHPRPARIPDTIVFVGSLIPRKGVKYLLQAMTSLPERYRLEIAGDGPSRAKLEEAVSQLGLTGRVAFLGALTQHELAELLGRCHTFVLPSLSEGLPLSLLEAMASGCAVVSTDVSGIKDLVTDEVTGLLVPPADPQALAQAVLRVLSDEELSKRLTSNALALVQERYSWESVAKRVAAVYASVLEDGNPSP
jgi:glycosyltransferase involved in cell wall biosynthesis